MITDEELGRWARRYHEAFVTEEDNNRATEIALSLVADRAMPRLIAEVERLRAELQDVKRGCEIALMDDVCAETRNAWIERAQSRLRDATRLPISDAAERLVDELMMGGRK